MSDIAAGLVHSSCVTFQKQGVLVIGTSGSGKSVLVADLISRGGRLVSDDQTVVKSLNDAPVASPPEALKGLLELRGIGLVTMPFDASAAIDLVVDLDHAPSARLPEPKRILVCGHSRPLLAGKDIPNLTTSIIVYIQSLGRVV